MIDRHLYRKIVANLSRQKVSLLIGARRVGKTELLLKLADEKKNECLFLNGEDANTALLLKHRSVSNYKQLLQKKKLLIIDEAQYIPDIGRIVRLMIDEIKPLHIIITGSGALGLQQDASEPLVGRTITYQMYPIAQMELAKRENSLDTINHLEQRLVYGSYPEVITTESSDEKEEYLRELVNVLLLKDILSFENIRNPQKIKDLLRLLAFQIGSEVSMEQLGSTLQLSKNTVERYIDLLAKTFIIFNRGGYSRNLRKEVTKMQRWYFYDNGIRNAVTGNFSPLALRQDTGQLWENYVIYERLKYTDYSSKNINSFFWRTYDQQEIDLVEEKNNSLQAFEIKWKAQKTKVPVAFEKAYPDAAFRVVTRENYLDIIQ